ncbi:MAG: YbaN family protein [Vicinamibacterales bacterium]
MLVRVLFAAAGLMFVGLGVLGILLPGLPATPFLLLAGYCFARSFPRLHEWFVTHPWFGPYIKGARSGWRIPRRQAMQTIAVLWISMGVTAWLVDRWWVRVLLLVIAAGVSIFLERRSRVPRTETI